MEVTTTITTSKIIEQFSILLKVKWTNNRFKFFAYWTLYAEDTFYQCENFVDFMCKKSLPLNCRIFFKRIFQEFIQFSVCFAICQQQQQQKTVSHINFQYILIKGKKYRRQGWTFEKSIKWFPKFSAFCAKAFFNIKNIQ